MTKLYILAISILLFASCEKHEVSLNTDGDINKQEVKFKFFVEEGDNLIPYETYWNAVNAPLSRASSVPAQFNLYGVLNSVDVPDGTGDVTSIEDAPVDKRIFNSSLINSDGTYIGDRRYWIADGKTRHTFAAIAGHSSTGSMTYYGFTKDKFIPVADYYLDSDPKTQTDLLLAYGPTNVIVDGVAPVVNIHFKHALSKLLFKIISAGGVTLYNCTMNIKYNVTISRNVAYWYTTKFYTSWSNPLGGTYSIGSAITIPTTATNTERAVEIGDMMMHSINLPNDWLEISLTYTKTIGGPSTTLTARLPAQQFKPGMQYTYYVYVSEVAEVLTISSIEVAPWTTDIRMADPLN